MKKICIVLAAIGAVSLVSCEREQSFEEQPLGKNELRIALQGPASTRSQELTEPETFSFFAGKDDASGLAFYLEETVEDLNAAWSPATKGTPAYTENLGKLYGSMSIVAKGQKEDVETTFWAMDNEQRKNAGWRYQGEIGWGEDAYDFYMSMPEDMTSNGVSGLTPGKTENKLKYTFSYTSPSTATSQQDIIFAARNITKEEAETNRVEGVPVLFHHALTGVKFRIANNDVLEKGKDGHTQTYITKVTISGLKNSGTCTITPREETEGYVDDRTGDYSSGDKTFTSGVVAWTYKDGTGTFSQEFNEAQNTTNYSGSTTTTGVDGKEITTSGSFPNKGNYPNTFSDAGNTYNLNDADASMTFWFIPQALTAAVRVTVEFHVWDGQKNQETKTLTLNLGEEVLKMKDEDGKNYLTLTRDWKAGQLRTFSLKPNNVDIEIDDYVDETEKKDVVIRNTGNVNMYVRAYITGGWADEEDTYVIGYINADPYDNQTVAPWILGSTKTGATVTVPNNYGTFTNLALSSRNWVVNGDYYYYTEAIGPGDQVPSTNPLFDSYKVGTKPTVYMPKRDNIMERELITDKLHMMMDIVVQAVEADKFTDYKDAWNNAAGVTFSN